MNQCPKCQSRDFVDGFCTHCGVVGGVVGGNKTQVFNPPPRANPLVTKSPSQNSTNPTFQGENPGGFGQQKTQVVKPSQPTSGGVPLQNPPPDATPVDDEVASDTDLLLLGAIIQDDYIFKTLLGKGLKADSFVGRGLRNLARAIFKHKDSTPKGESTAEGVDLVILKNRLKQFGQFDESMKRVFDRLAQMPRIALAQASTYFDLLMEKALRRQVLDIGEGLVHFTKNPQDNPSETLDSYLARTIHGLRDLTRKNSSKRIQLIRQGMKEIIQDIDRREREGEVKTLGYSLEPYSGLNLALSGLRKGFFYAIAGAPRRGKTTFTLELATAIATNDKVPVLFFTFEQTKKNLTYRLLAKESRLNPDTLQRKKIRNDMVTEAKFLAGWKKMQEYMDFFHIIEGTKEDNLNKIRAYALNTMQEFETDEIVIFIDYIQKMPLDLEYSNEKFKVEEISTGLKQLCIELNCPIVTISSLTKEGCVIDGTNDSERPTMYDCKGSGDIEYDLDCAMIQAKDWEDTHEVMQQLAYKAEQMGKDSKKLPKIEVINLHLDKNRDAPEGMGACLQYFFFIEDNKFKEIGFKSEDESSRFARIERLVSQMIQENYIVFYDAQNFKKNLTGNPKLRMQP